MKPARQPLTKEEFIRNIKEKKELQGIADSVVEETLQQYLKKTPP